MRSCVFRFWKFKKETFIQILRPLGPWPKGKWLTHDEFIQTILENEKARFYVYR